MDTDRITDVAPHYAAVAVLALLLLNAVKAVVGMNFWIGLAVIAAVAVSYRPVVVRLGIGPRSWE